MPLFGLSMEVTMGGRLVVAMVLLYGDRTWWGPVMTAIARCIVRP